VNKKDDIFSTDFSESGNGVYTERAASIPRGVPQQSIFNQSSGSACVYKGTMESRDGKPKAVSTQPAMSTNNLHCSTNLDHIKEGMMVVNVSQNYFPRVFVYCT